MQSRRKIMVVVLAVVLSVLFLGAVALLVMGFIQYFEVESALADSKGSLQRLYARNPFPSSDNLKVERTNNQEVQKELADLQAALGAGQVDPVGQSPAKFVTQFWETRKSLLGSAGAAIKVDKNFDFGFGRHMKGDLPASQDVPRLTQQLKIVENLCTILFSSGISSLTGIARQEFEVDAVGPAAAKPAAVGRRGAESVMKNTVDANAGLILPGALHGRWHFVLHFTSRESAVMNTLNGLANNPMFVVVTRLEVKGDDVLFSRKEKEAAKAAMAEGGEAASKEVAKSRDYRVVCGRDNQLNVVLELDVYQFAKPPVAGSMKQPGGTK